MWRSPEPPNRKAQKSREVAFPVKTFCLLNRTPANLKDRHKAAAQNPPKGLRGARMRETQVQPHPFPATSFSSPTPRARTRASEGACAQPPPPPLRAPVRAPAPGGQPALRRLRSYASGGADASATWSPGAPLLLCASPRFLFLAPPARQSSVMYVPFCPVTCCTGAVVYMPSN